MNKSSIWVSRHLKLFIVLVLSIVLIACADDQDATTKTPDSTGVKSDDPNGNQSLNAAQKLKPEPHDMDDATVTRLALLKSEAGTYRHGKQFIIELPNNTNNDTLTNRGFGRWYTIPDTSQPRKLNERNRDRVRNKIYGYLTYHDMVVKYPAAPHTIFFQWYRRGSNIDSVVVWISPAPVFKEDTSASTLTLVSDPPRPRVPPPPPME